MSTTPRGTVSTVEMGVALRKRHRVHEAHLPQVAPAQERRGRSAPRFRRPGTRRRLRPASSALERLLAADRQKRRAPLHRAAFAQQHAARAIACRCPRRRPPSGFRRAPRACRPAAGWRPGISTSARSRARPSETTGGSPSTSRQRLADAALDERDVDPAVAQEREVFGGAPRLPELERHAVLREILAILLAVFLVRAAGRARRHDEMVRRRRLDVLERDPERERDERDHRHGDDERVARPPVSQRPHTRTRARPRARGRRRMRQSPFEASWMRLLPDFSSRSSFRLPRRSASSSISLNERKP